MAKKKTSLNQTGLASTLFNTINPYEQGKKEQVLSSPTKLLITTILPDPKQPRRLLPAQLSRALFEGKTTPIEAMNAWLSLSDEASEDTKTQKNLVELRKLADSIEQHGLINPITVREIQLDETVPAGIDYLIVTGERRYWAHVYLLCNNKQIQEGKTSADPNEIKVTLSAKGITIRAHQLIENLVREDINAVEKAQGMWALRYELSGVNHGSPDEAFDTEVNHGSPLVTWEAVQNTLSISKRYRIFLTSVLNLCEEAQDLISTHNLSERMVRPVTQKLKNHPNLQVKALQQLIAWQMENESENGPGRPLTKSITAFVNQLLNEGNVPPKQTKTKTRKTEPSFRLPDPKEFERRIGETLVYLSEIQGRELISLTKTLARAEKYVDTVDNLQQLRDHINEILTAISSHGK